MIDLVDHGLNGLRIVGRNGGRTGASETGPELLSFAGAEAPASGVPREAVATEVFVAVSVATGAALSAAALATNSRSAAEGLDANALAESDIPTAAETIAQTELSFFIDSTSL